MELDLSYITSKLSGVGWEWGREGEGEIRI